MWAEGMGGVNGLKNCIVLCSECAYNMYHFQNNAFLAHKLRICQYRCPLNKNKYFLKICIVYIIEAIGPYGPYWNSPILGPLTRHVQILVTFDSKVRLVPCIYDLRTR